MPVGRRNRSSKHCKGEGLSAKSRKAYEHALTSLHRWFLHADGSVPEPRALGREHIAEFLGCQRTVGRLSPATVNQQLTSLCCYFAWAQGLTDHNPDERIRLPKQRKPEPRSPTRAEVLLLYRTAREGARGAATPSSPHEFPARSHPRPALQGQAAVQ